MQALGSYKRGLLLFLGFGTSLGAALMVNGVVIPMELAHLSFKNGTYQDYLGVRRFAGWAGRSGRSTSSSRPRG